jgi:acetate---CoA ligase (ADP-forming)
MNGETSITRRDEQGSTVSADSRVLNIQKLFSPKSIAIFGASERPRTIGTVIAESLRNLQFSGPIWSINPKYDRLYEHPCFPSVDALPGVPDIVAFGVKGDAAVAALETLGVRGVRAVALYDHGFAESGSEGAALQSRLVEICRKYDMALCGPNCMGTLSPHDRFSSYRLPITNAAAIKGNVSLISHSGSITIGLLADVRRFGFSRVVSSGNEAVLDAVDYLHHFLDDPNTRVIAAFLETVRRPVEFRAALERAAEMGKPVVVLKVGRSARASRAIVSHTGGLAGETRIFSEVLRRANAIEVSDLVEMTEVLTTLQGPRWPRGRRIAVATGSGGQAELLLDLAEGANLQLPPLPPHAAEEVERVIGPLTGDGNPLDAWGNGDIQKNITHALDVLGREPAYDAVALCNEQADDAPVSMPQAAISILAEAAAKSDKPFYCLNLRPGIMRKANVDLLQARGVMTLGGGRQGLAAIDSVGRYELRRQKPRAQSAAGSQRNPVAAERRRVVNEFEAKRLLRQFGVPVPEEVLVRSPDAACAQAEKIGWPVVLKVVSDAVAHKTEHGLIRLNLRSAEEVRVAFGELMQRFEIAAPGGDFAGVVVQPMIVDGVEVFAGLRCDPDWGLVLAFGFGGTLLEIVEDVALRVLPLEDGDTRDMITETKAARVLAGVRGAPPADIGALESCLQALAAFGAACGGDLLECDINPIKVLPQRRGCIALDALIVLNRP